MDKFLCLCFKIGKWVLVIILMVLFLAGLFLGGVVIAKTIQLQSAKIDYTLDKKAFEKDIKQQATEAANQPIPLPQTVSSKKDLTAQYLTTLKEAFGKQTISGAHLDLVASYANKYIHEEDINAFLKHYPVYFNDMINISAPELQKQYPDITLEIIKEKIINAKEIREGIFEAYTAQYDKQVKLKEKREIELKSSRLMALYALLGTLAVFIIILILPILIKIEENTRK